MSAAGGAAAPDIESSGDGYARRFSGAAGDFFLARQQQVFERMLDDKHRVGVLDVGGGHAQLSGFLAAAGHAVTVLGSTPACAGRLSLDTRNADVRFVCGDLLALPFPDGAFDTVLSIRLLAHVERWGTFVAELCRVARRTVVVDYPELVSLNLLSLATFGLKQRIEGDTRRFRSFRATTLVRGFARSGFRLRARDRQFLLPMALHRAGGGAGALRGAEAVARAAGITARFGNPGVLRFDRTDGAA